MIHAACTMLRQQRVVEEDQSPNNKARGTPPSALKPEESEPDGTGCHIRVESIVRKRRCQPHKAEQSTVLGMSAF